MNKQLLLLLERYWDKHYDVSLEDILDEAFFYCYTGLDWESGNLPNVGNSDIIKYLNKELGL